MRLRKWVSLVQPFDGHKNLCFQIYIYLSLTMHNYQNYFLGLVSIHLRFKGGLISHADFFYKATEKNNNMASTCGFVKWYLALLS